MKTKQKKAKKLTRPKTSFPKWIVKNLRLELSELRQDRQFIKNDLKKVEVKIERKLKELQKWIPHKKQKARKPASMVSFSTDFVSGEIMKRGGC